MSHTIEILCICDEPGCEKSLVFYPWGVRINDSRDSFKEDCGLPAPLLNALAHVAENAPPNTEEPYAFARWDDEDGNDLCLVDGYVNVEMARGTMLSMEIPDNIYAAMQEALVAHGAVFERWEEYDPDDRESLHPGDFHYLNYHAHGGDER